MTITNFEAMNTIRRRDNKCESEIWKFLQKINFVLENNRQIFFRNSSHHLAHLFLNPSFWKEICYDVCENTISAAGKPFIMRWEE